MNRREMMQAAAAAVAGAALPAVVPKCVNEPLKRTPAGGDYVIVSDPLRKTALGKVLITHGTACWTRYVTLVMQDGSKGLARIYRQSEALHYASQIRTHS